MKTRTKFILQCLLAAVALPLLAMLVMHKHVSYALDSGSQTLSLAELQGGTHPGTVHLTITHAAIDDRGGVELTQSSKRSTKYTHFVPLRSTDDPSAPTPVVVISETNPSRNKQNAFAGIWVNADTGLDANIASMLKEQGITLADKPLILDVDKSRESSMLLLAYWVGGAFLVPLLVLGIGTVLTREPEDPALAEQRREASKPLVESDAAALREKLTAALRAHFPGVESDQLTVSGSFVVGTDISVLLDGNTYPAPGDIQTAVMAFHKVLKRHKVPFSHINYSAGGGLNYY